MPGQDRIQDFFCGVLSSTEGAERVGCGEGVSSCPLKNFCILNMKMTQFGAFLVGLE
jgi:hypothetical protein